MLTPVKGVRLAQGIEGVRGHRRWPCSHGTECRGLAPQSPVFCGAKNAPKYYF
jgi:hypothetical protein